MFLRLFYISFFFYFSIYCTDKTVRKMMDLYFCAFGVIIFKQQWKPLNVITLGPRDTDNINGMIRIIIYFYAVM